MKPTAEEIKQTETKKRPLPVEPWVAAYLSRVWQDMKKNISDTIVVDSLARGQANSSTTPPRSCAGTQEQPHTVQSEPASSRNQS